MADNKTKIVISAEDRASGAIKGITTQLQGLVAPVAGLSAAFAGLASAVGGLSLAAFVKDAVAVGSKLNDLSIATGATVEQLSAMTDIAELADVGLDQVAIGLQKLSKNMVDAASGGKQSAAVFKALGVSIRDGAGNIRDSGEMMQSVAKAIAGLSSGTERAAAAQLAFGKSGAQLLPMMKDLAEAGELQSRWTTEQADLADRVGDNFTRLGQAYRHLGEEIGKTALPALRDFSEVMVEAASAPGSLAAGIRQMAQDGTLKEWAEGGALAVAALVDVLRAAAGGVEAVGKGIAAAAALLGARSPEQAKAIIAAFGKDFDRIWNQEQLVDKLKARFAQLPAEMAKAAASAGGTGFADLLDKENRKIAKSVDEFARLMERLNAKDAGLDASFWKDLATLHDAYDKGRIGIEAYRAAVEKLVTQQKFHQDALAASAKAEKEWADAANRAAEAGRRSLESLQEKARAAEEELATYGLTRSEIESTIIARLEEQRAVAAAADNEHALVEALDAEIEARRRLRDASRGLEAREASRKAIDDQAKAWENFSRDIEQSLTDALMRSFEAGDNFGEAFVKTLQNTLKTAALKLAVQVVMQPVMGSMGQALGYTQGGAGGGGLGGMSNIFSPISNIATSSIGGSAFGAGMLSGVSESLLGASFVGPSASLAGNASIAAGASFGSFLPAIGIGLGLLSLFGGDLFGGKEKPPEINIANVPKGTKWAASAGAGPFGELQMAGKHLGETEQEVQKMVDALLKPMIQADTALAQLLTGAEVKAISGALEGWTSGEVEFEGEAQVQEMVKARFAIISDTIGGWVDALADTVTGTSEEVYTALGQILAQRNAEGAQTIAEQILGADDGRFSEEGENLAATFNRLMSSLTTVNAAFDLLDQNLLQISADSGVWADKLVDAFGGLESLQGSVAAYYDKYYSDAEKVANTTSQLTKAFGKLGYELPDSKEELRKWIDSIPLLTDEQRKTYAELIKLAPAFSDLADAMAKTTATALTAAEAERKSEIEARRAMQKAAQTSVDAAREGLNTLKTDLAAESSRTAGGYAGGSYLDAAELERYSGFVEYLTEAGAELQKLADSNVAGAMDGAISSIKGMMDEAARELASRLSIERLLAGNVGGAIGAASAPGMAGLTWEGNAGAFNAQIAEVQARAAAGLLNAANANALTIPNIDSVIDQLIQTAGENPGGRGLLGVRAAAEAYSRAITDGVEQEIREGLAANLGRAGLESVAFYFGQIGEQAKKLTAASIEANDALAQTNAAIGRLGSVGAAFGQSAAAAYYGFMDGGAEGRMYLNDPATGAMISQSALIASAAQIAAGVMTTADAAAVAKKLSDQFTDKRGASLLLDGLQQYDAGSFENAFLRMNDALVKGALNEAQYTELFGLAVDEFTGASEEAAKMGETFERVRDAARSLADELMVDPNTSRLSRNNMLGESRRQWEDAMTRATAMQDSSGLESSARNYLRAVSESTASGDVYDQGFAQVIADLRGLEQLFPPKPATKTTDDVVAELNSMRSDMRALGAQQSSNEQKLNRLLQSVYDGDALQVRVLT